MALILLAFAGTLAIFFRIWRELDAIRRSLGDLRESLQYYAVDAAQQNRDLANLVEDLRDRAAPEGPATPAPVADNLGALLEKGLPNLMEAASFEEEAVAGPAHSESLRFGAEEEEKDFLRRLEPGMRKTPAP
ncbi:MAG: hypothetical protein LIP28_08530 [Deltaproteobacteria bacterium]|nr:hypothetical protein [Deltaproteobacteria bacterium]